MQPASQPAVLIRAYNCTRKNRHVLRTSGINVAGYPLLPYRTSIVIRFRIRCFARKKDTEAATQQQVQIKTVCTPPFYYVAKRPPTINRVIMRIYNMLEKQRARKVFMPILVNH